MDRFSLGANLLLWAFPGALIVLALVLYAVAGRRGGDRP